MNAKCIPSILTALAQASEGQKIPIDRRIKSLNLGSNRWLTTIHVNPKKTGGINREDLRLALEAENIESRPLWKPMHMQPVFQDFPYYGDGLSEKLFEIELCLPSGSNLTDEDKGRVVGVIEKTIQK